MPSPRPWKIVRYFGPLTLSVRVNRTTLNIRRTESRTRGACTPSRAWGWFTLHPAPCTLHPEPCTLNPTPFTLHPTPYTLHPTPYTLHPTPYTLNPKP